MQYKSSKGLVSGDSLCDPLLCQRLDPSVSAVLLHGGSPKHCQSLLNLSSDVCSKAIAKVCVCVVR